jgi:hypothetical protein
VIAGGCWIACRPSAVLAGVLRASQCRDGAAATLLAVTSRRRRAGRLLCSRNDNRQEFSYNEIAFHKVAMFLYH